MLEPAQDTEAFIDHVIRHMGESGRAKNGKTSTIFSPYPLGTQWDAPGRDVRRADLLKRWSQPIGEAGWERVWIVEVDGIIRAHLDLRTWPMATQLHRALLGMGVEEAFHRRGFGQALMTVAIDWAREGESLAWIDLQVFDHNQPALELYRSLGFREVGRVQDFFRIGGQKIGDVHMVLEI